MKKYNNTFTFSANQILSFISVLIPNRSADWPRTFRMHFDQSFHNELVSLRQYKLLKSLGYGSQWNHLADVQNSCNNQLRVQ